MLQALADLLLRYLLKICVSFALPVLLVDIISVQFHSVKAFSQEQTKRRMIIGSYYLTKKAKKAYRKHQAGKAAERLTEAVKVDDPSSELTLQVPPSSPTGSQISLNSTPDTDSPSTVVSVGSPIRASRSSHDLRFPLSQHPSPSNQKSAAGANEFEQFVRRQSNDYLHQISEQPPSYDTAIASPISKHAQQVSPQLSEPPSALSATSSHPSWSSHYGLHSHCPTCYAIVQQHQQDEHHVHHPLWPQANLEHHADIDASHPFQNRSSLPVVHEMSAAPILYPQNQITQCSRPISELPDTEIFETEAPVQYSQALPIIELPADVLEQLFHHSITDEVERQSGSTQKVQQQTASELPAP